MTTIFPIIIAIVVVLWIWDSYDTQRYLKKLKKEFEELQKQAEKEREETNNV